MTARRGHVSRASEIRRTAMQMIYYRIPMDRQAEARKLAGTEPIPMVLAMIKRMKGLPDVTATD